MHKKRTRAYLYTLYHKDNQIYIDSYNTNGDEHDINKSTVDILYIFKKNVYIHIDKCTYTHISQMLHVYLNIYLPEHQNFPSKKSLLWAAIKHPFGPPCHNTGSGNFICNTEPIKEHSVSNGLG